MRKSILTLVASAALAFGIAGQASARDYHDGGHRGGGYHQDRGDRHYDRGGHNRHYDRGHDRHRSHGRHYYRQHHQNYRPYYSGYYDSPYAYGPPAPYYGGYGYGVGYSQPGFGIYIGR